MPRLAACDIAAVREIERRLVRYEEGSSSALAWVLPALGELLRTEKTLAYGLAPRGDAARCDWVYGNRAMRPRALAPAFDEWLGRHDLSWAGYDPMRPEPVQRNRVLGLSFLLDLTGRHASPVFDFYSKLGLGGRDQLRVLLCDGPSLLAWVGAFQPEAFDAHQRRLLTRLVPALRRRLILERSLATHDGTRAALDAAMEAIPAAAFLVAQSGAVSHANAAGCALLDSEGRRTKDAIVRALAAPAEASAPFRITRVAPRCGPESFLLVLRATCDSDYEHRAVAAARGWGLTARQGEVLRLLVRGKSNRTIAAILGVAERTVEAHLTAIFEKVGLEGRCALVARVWGGG